MYPSSLSFSLSLSLSFFLSFSVSDVLPLWFYQLFFVSILLTLSTELHLSLFPPTLSLPVCLSLSPSYLYLFHSCASINSHYFRFIHKSLSRSPSVFLYIERVNEIHKKRERERERERERRSERERGKSADIESTCAWKLLVYRLRGQLTVTIPYWQSHMLYHWYWTLVNYKGRKLKKNNYQLVFTNSLFRFIRSVIINKYFTFI